MNDRSHKRKLDSVIDPASKKKATVEDDRWIFDTEEPDYKPVESLKGSLLPDPAKRGKIYCRDRNVEIRHCLFGYKIDSCPNLLEHTVYMQSRSILNNAIQGSDVICSVVTKALLKQPNGAWPPYYFDLRHAEDLTNGSIRRIQEKVTELYGYGSPVVLCNEITPALRMMADGLRRTVCQYTTPLLSNATETIKEFRLAVKSYAQEVHYRCPMFAIKADLLDALDAENILLSGLDSTGPGLWKFDRVVYVTDATALMPPPSSSAHMTLRTEQAVHVSLGIGNISADAIVRVVRLLKGETFRECEWDDMPYIKQDPALTANTANTTATNTILDVPTDAESDIECRTHHSDISLLADTLVFDETTVDLSIDNDSHAAAPAAPQTITTLSRAEQALRIRIAALQAQRAALLARQLHNRQHNTTEPTSSTSAGNGHTVPHHHRSKTSALASARSTTTTLALTTATTSRNSTSDPKNNDATTTTVTTTVTTSVTTPNTTTTATLSAMNQELRDSRRPGQPHATVARSPPPVSLSEPQAAAPPPARKSADRVGPAPTTTATTDSSKTLNTVTTITTSTLTTAISTNTTTTSSITPLATLTLAPTILTAPTTRTTDKVCNDSDSSLSRVPDSPTTALRQAGNTIRDSKWVKVKFSGTLPAASGVSNVCTDTSSTKPGSAASQFNIAPSTPITATNLNNTTATNAISANTNTSKPPSPTSVPAPNSTPIHTIITTTTTTTPTIPTTASTKITTATYTEPATSTTTTTTTTNTSTSVTTNSISSSNNNDMPKKVARQYVPKPKDEILPLTMPITASASFCSTTSSKAEVLHTGTATTATTPPTVATMTTNNTVEHTTNTDTSTNTINTTITPPAVLYTHHETTGMHLYTTTEEDLQRLEDFAEVSIPDSLQAELRALPKVVVTRRAPPPADLMPGTVYVELNDDTIPVGEFYHAVRKQLGLE